MESSIGMSLNFTSLKILKTKYEAKVSKHRSENATMYMTDISFDWLYPDPYLP